jgi:hypothetical protein
MSLVNWFGCESLESFQLHHGSKSIDFSAEGEITVYVVTTRPPWWHGTQEAELTVLIKWQSSLNVSTPRPNVNLKEGKYYKNIDTFWDMTPFL